MLLFSWMGLVDVVRAEFLRARNFDYVRAARALGVSDRVIILRHVLPNATVATITFLPFILNGSITTLTSLDFLGFGLPPGSPSLGELLAQGKANLQAPWLGLTAFFVLAVDAEPVDLCRRGGARRVRPAQGGACERREAAPRRCSKSAISASPLPAAAGRPPVEAVKGVSFTLDRGETLALVGESGSGKSVTALSVLQLLPYPVAAHGPESSIRFAGEELVGAAPERLRRVRGNRIAMVFQEPMTSLNPLHTLERQIAETLLIHKHMSAAAARERTIELLRLVGLPDAENRLGAYPHQLSGGQRQRVMIAMAIANEPDILIADEPTTALDVTIQAHILQLLKDLRDRFGMALLLITHDLTIVRKMADRVCIMTAGEIVEAGPTAEIFARPRHPYTRRLLAAEPKGRAAPADPAAPRDDRGGGGQGLVSDPPRRAAPGRRLRQGGRRRLARGAARAPRSASSAKAARARRRWAWHCCG